MKLEERKKKIIKLLDWLRENGYGYEPIMGDYSVERIVVYILEPTSTGGEDKEWKELLLFGFY